MSLLQFYSGPAFGGGVIGAVCQFGREGDLGLIQTPWTL